MNAMRCVCVCMLVMCHLGCTSGQDEQPLDEMRGALITPPDHGEQDEDGVWHVDAGRLFKFNVEAKFEPKTRCDETMLVDFFSREGERTTMLHGAVIQAGRYDLDTKDGVVISIEAHDRDFAQGSSELTFGPLGQGEELLFAGRGVSAVSTDRPDRTSLTAVNDGETIRVLARAEGRSYVFIRSSGQSRLITLDVLAADEIPASAKKVIKLKLGESWSGVSGVGVKSVSVGVPSRVSVKADERTIELTAREVGVTPITFMSDYGETTTLWLRVVGVPEAQSSDESSPVVEKSMGTLRFEAAQASKKAQTTESFEVEYVEVINAEFMRSFSEGLGPKVVPKQGDDTLTTSGVKPDKTFTLKRDEPLKFSSRAISRVILEAGHVRCDSCDEGSAHITLIGTKPGKTYVLLVSKGGSRKLIMLDVLPKT